MPTLLKMQRRVGEYTISVEGDEESAIAKVETDFGAVILDSAYKAVEGKIINHEYVMDAMEVAEHAATEAYHQAVGTVDGLVNINSLITHPFNELIYGEEEVGDLVDLLSKKDGQIFQVTINPKGQILAGNRRVKAGIEINRQLAAQGKLPKFEDIPTRVLAFASPEAELKYMVLHNQGRKKTKQQIAEEVSALIALAESPAIPIDTRISSQELIGQIEKDLGVSRATAFNAKEALKQANKIKDPLFREQVKGFIVDVPNKARQLMEANPPRSAGLKKEDYQKKLLEHIKKNPCDSVKTAIAEVNATLVPKEESDILRQMRDKKDVPNDNRKTPKEIIELASDVLGVMDIDAFAMATDPDWIPAAKCYTILDDAWSQTFEGNVFANPPFSKASEAIALMDKHIRNGGIKKLFLILPAGVLSTKSFHSLVKDHNPCIYLPSKRLQFEPGELLRAEKDSVTTGSNREPSVIVFYSTEIEDYTTMIEAVAGKGWCGRQYTPTNPYQLFSEINDLKWIEAPTGEESSFYGTPIAVAKEGKKFSALMNGEAIATKLPSVDVAKKIAVMEAISSFSF